MLVCHNSWFKGFIPELSSSQVQFCTSWATEQTRSEKPNVWSWLWDANT